MLVLSRKADQVIVIDGSIRVRVLEVVGSRVRLGIEAPREVGIVREELTHEQRAPRGAKREQGAGQAARVLATQHEATPQAEVAVA